MAQDLHLLKEAPKHAARSLMSDLMWCGSGVRRGMTRPWNIWNSSEFFTFFLPLNAWSSKSWEAACGPLNSTLSVSLGQQTSMFHSLGFANFTCVVFLVQHQICLEQMKTAFSFKKKTDFLECATCKEKALASLAAFFSQLSSFDCLNVWWTWPLNPRHSWQRSETRRWRTLNAGIAFFSSSAASRDAWKSDEPQWFRLGTTKMDLSEPVCPSAKRSACRCISGECQGFTVKASRTTPIFRCNRRHHAMSDKTQIEDVWYVHRKPPWLQWFLPEGSQHVQCPPGALVHWCHEWLASLSRHHSVLDDSNGSIDLTAFPNWQDGWKWTGMGTCTIQSLSCIIDLSLFFILYSTSWSHSTVSEKWSATLFQWVTSVGATKAILCPAKNIQNTGACRGQETQRNLDMWLWPLRQYAQSGVQLSLQFQWLPVLMSNCANSIWCTHMCVLCAYDVCIYIYVKYVCYECLCVDA